MGKKYFHTPKRAFFLTIFAVVLLAAQSAFAVDILEIRVKRLYKEAQALAENGDYDGAIEIYNKAILMAKDKDIKQYLINAKRALQKKKRAERGDYRIFRMEEKPEEMIFEPMTGGVTPAPKAETPEEKQTAEEKSRLEKERAALEAERRQLEAERARLEEEKSETAEASFEEKRRRAEEERQKALKAFEETPEKVMHKEELPEEAAVAEQKPSEEKESDTDLEARKEREARDRMIYESSAYRLRVKEILNGVKNRMKEASLKVEEEEAYTRVESKIHQLTALDQQAEEFLSKGEYEKAKGVYEEILTMSKDADLKAYIKKQKETKR